MAADEAGRGLGIRALTTPHLPTTAFVAVLAPHDVRLHRTHVRGEPRLLSAAPSLAPLVRVAVRPAGRGTPSPGLAVRRAPSVGSELPPAPEEPADAVPPTTPPHEPTDAVPPSPLLHVPADAVPPTPPPDVPAVPVHRGPDAERVAARSGARAVTDRAGVHLPDRHGTLTGPRAQALLAHELVHAARSVRGRPAADTGDAAEAEERHASAVEAAVRAGTRPPPVVARAVHDADEAAPVEPLPPGRTPRQPSPPAPAASDAPTTQSTPSARREGRRPALAPTSSPSRTPSSSAPSSQPPPTESSHSSPTVSAHPPPTASRRSSRAPDPTPPAVAAPSSFLATLAGAPGTVHRAPEAPLPPEPSAERTGTAGSTGATGATGRSLDPRELDRIYRAVRERLERDRVLERERTGGLVDRVWR